MLRVQPQLPYRGHTEASMAANLHPAAITGWPTDLCLLIQTHFTVSRHFKANDSQPHLTRGSSQGLTWLSLCLCNVFGSFLGGWIHVWINTSWKVSCAYRVQTTSGRWKTSEISPLWEQLLEYTHAHTPGWKLYWPHVLDILEEWKEIAGQSVEYLSKWEELEWDWRPEGLVLMLLLHVWLNKTKEQNWLQNGENLTFVLNVASARSIKE